MATGNVYTENWAKSGRVVFEACKQSNRQTNIHADDNTSHP